MDVKNIYIYLFCHHILLVILYGQFFRTLPVLLFLNVQCLSVCDSGLVINLFGPADQMSGPHGVRQYAGSGHGVLHCPFPTLCSGIGH